MTKKKLSLEYELLSSSENIIWSLISTPEGLARWLADEVTQEGDELTFTWGELWQHHQIKKATLLEKDKPNRIRFRWNDDTDEDVYVELRIEKSDLTNDCILMITDFAVEYDADDMKELWDYDIERLHRETGV